MANGDRRLLHTQLGQASTMIERECDGRLALFETLHVHSQACRQDSSRQEITEGKSDDGVTRGRAKHCVAQRVLCTRRLDGDCAQAGRRRRWSGQWSGM